MLVCCGDQHVSQSGVHCEMECGSSGGSRITSNMHAGIVHACTYEHAHTQASSRAAYQNFSGRSLICGDWCASSCLCDVVIDMFSQSVAHCCEAVFSTLGCYKFTVDSEITVQSRILINVYFKELNCLFCQMV